jgi:hypothetical protein
METFRISKLWKMRIWVVFGSALGFLFLLLAIGIFVVWPSQRSNIAWIEFGWWVPYFMIFLFIVSIIAAVNLRKMNRYSLELSEETIHAGRVQMQLENIAVIEHKKRRDENLLVLQSKLKNKMEIPGGLDGYLYVNAFIENHAKNATRLGEEKSVVNIAKQTRLFISMIQGWKKDGIGYSKRFELLKQGGFRNPTASSLLGLAENQSINPKEAQGLIEQIRNWKSQGKDEPACLAMLVKEGFNPMAAQVLLVEADRNLSPSG